MMFNELSSNTLKLYEKYAEKYPGVNYEHFTALGNCGWYGLELSEKEIVDVLEKCIRENKIFQVWDIKWKGDDMPDDWWEGKLVFKKYNPKK